MAMRLTLRSFKHKKCKVSNTSVLSRNWSIYKLVNLRGVDPSLTLGVWFGGVSVPIAHLHKGVSQGWCAPLRSWKILYFCNWNHAIWWILLGAKLQTMSKKQLFGPDLPKFWILGGIFDKSLLESWKISHFLSKICWFWPNISKDNSSQNIV